MTTLDDTPDVFVFPAGNQAPILMRVFGYLLFLFGLAFLLESSLAGLTCILIGTRMAATVSGIQIDVLNGKYRAYTAYAYVLKIGKWKSLDSYPYLSVLGTNAGFTASRFGSDGTTLLERVWDVYFLNENHRSKLYVTRFKKEQAAWEKAEAIAFVMEKKVATYAPVISAASKAKRNRGRRR